MLGRFVSLHVAFNYNFFLASALMPRLLPCDHIISPTPGQPLTDNRGPLRQSQGRIPACHDIVRGHMR